MRAHFTPQAEIDLEEVGDYIALDNPRRAVSFIREIRQYCEKIAEGPHHYVARPDLGGTIRICAHGNYLIVFEPFDDGALILRVLHGARNVPSRRLLYQGPWLQEEPRRPHAQRPALPDGRAAGAGLSSGALARYARQSRARLWPQPRHLHHRSAGHPQSL